MAIKTGDVIAASDFNFIRFSLSLSNLSSGGYSAYCIGPVCIIVIDKIYTGSSVPNGSVVIGTIPSGYRPAHYTRAMLTRGYQHGILLGAETDGRIIAYYINQNDIITGQLVYFRQ